MAPGATLQELIDTVRADAGADNPLSLLAQASTLVGEMEQVGDALLGHFVDQCRADGLSWSEISGALGVSKQAVHKRFSVGVPSLERFTERARGVLREALEEARTADSLYVLPEHLLLALFDPPGALAAQILREAGLTRAGCAEQVAALPPTVVAATNLIPGQEEERPSRSGLSDTLRGAVHEAINMGHNYIGTEHMLIALYRSQGSTAVTVLNALGLSEDKAREALKAKFAEYAEQRKAAKAGQ